MAFPKYIINSLICLWLAMASVMGAEPGMKVLPGHVPGVVARLKPEGVVPATNQIFLAIGVALPNPATLNGFIAQLYDPGSPNYHRYLTPAEFAARFGPTAADYAAVEEFARTNGLTIRRQHGNRLLLDVVGSAGAVGRAFHVTLRRYHHPTEDREFYAPDTEPEVAAGLPIADISGLNNYSRPHPNFYREPVKAAGQAGPATGGQYTGSAPGGLYMGSDFRAAYVPGSPLTGAGQTVGLVQFDGFYSNDIVAYQNLIGITNYIPLQTVLIDGFNGTPTNNDGNTEVSLDIEMAMSMAPSLSSIVVFEGNVNNFIANDVLSQMASSNTIKNLSCSWNWNGGPSTTTDSIFLEMAAQGQTFFNAVGDSDAFPPGYVDNSTNITQPSSSPYITQVGGTTLTTAYAGGPYGSETVWNWGYNADTGESQGTSGGVSSHYSIPVWQQNISSFADNGGSTIYRNTPDVALTADQIYVLYGNGQNTSVGGTSCATPLWAGFMALVNQQAAASAKSPVGFINPAIYELANETRYHDVFNDVTNGNNTSSNSPNAFYAVPGYDLCTGLGSPGGTNLINALLNPDPLIVVSNYGFTAVISGAGVASVSAQTFYLTNVGAASLTWSLVNTSSWLNTSLTGGALAAGASQSVTVSLGAGAGSLRPGTYASTLCFSNVTSGVGQSRLFTLTVDDVLTVLPTNYFSFTGVVGGVFNPAGQTLVLTNPSSHSLNWSLGNNSSWFSLSASSGTLPADSQTAVTVIPVLNSISVDTGVYPVTLLLTDLTSQAVQPIAGQAFVTSTLVLNGGFETGDFTNWTLYGQPKPYNLVDNGVYCGITPYEGTNEAALGQKNYQGYIAQTLPTVAGQKYLLSLWFCNNLAGNYLYPNIFTVSWGGVTLYNQTNLPSFPWTQLQFYATATNASTVLKIASVNGYAYFVVDDVSVAPVVPPIFVLQPTNQLVFPGSSVVFNATLNGAAPLHYQWLENGTNLSNSTGTNSTVISGVNSDQLILSGVTAANDGNYSLKVTNLYGTNTSSVATLAVYSSPYVSVSPANGAGHVAFDFTGPAGYQYVILTATNLIGANWLAVYTNTFGTNGAGQFTEPQATNFPGRFYQLEVLP